MAQRGLLVRELYLPQAREEAEERHTGGSRRGGSKAPANWQEPSNVDEETTPDEDAVAEDLIANWQEDSGAAPWVCRH
jgi:hypothetical protein